MHATYSVDQGLNWSSALTLSTGGEGFVWPTHNAVAPNGDVYTSYHSQPFFAGGAPNGTSGRIFVLRSSDGGVSFPQKTSAFAAGEADITYNVQSAGFARILPQSASWTQGAAQPWVLPDPLDPDNVYVVAGDDPTNLNHGAGFDDMDVFIARSTDQGLTWSAPARIDGGAAGNIEFFPTAAIDDLSGCIAVTWYDTRAGATNAAGNFLLDLFMRGSDDGGLSFGPQTRINDVAFDPDLGAGARFAGPPPTLRIGEYNGVVVDDEIAHAVWTGNTATGQQIMFDSATPCAGVTLAFSGSCPGPMTLTVSGASSNGDVAIGWSSNPGSFTVPGGACAGTTVDLQAPQLLTILTSDAKGQASLNRDVAGGACGVRLQALDLSSCTPSNVGTVE